MLHKRQKVLARAPSTRDPERKPLSLETNVGAKALNYAYLVAGVAHGLSNSSRHLCVIAPAIQADRDLVAVVRRRIPQAFSFDSGPGRVRTKWFGWRRRAIAAFQRNQRGRKELTGCNVPREKFGSVRHERGGNRAIHYRASCVSCDRDDVFCQGGLSAVGPRDSAHVLTRAGGTTT